MYEVIKTHVADQGKQVKPFWVVGRFQTEAQARSFIAEKFLAEVFWDFKIEKVA